MVTWPHAVAGAAVIALAGCTAIAGYRDLTYAAAPPETCTTVILPASGEGRIRVVNAGTVGAASDFCVRASGSTDWGSPIFYAGAKAGCDTGLAYATATVPFAVPSGSIDVEAIPPGGTCGQGATSSATSLAVGNWVQGAPIVTVVRMGGGSSAEAIVARPEEPRALTSTGGDLIRVLNALSGAQPINLGIVTSSTLPQTIGAPVFPQPIPPGEVASAGTTALGAVDGAGYLDIEGYGAALGLVFADGTSAFAAFGLGVQAASVTVVAIGDSQSTSNAHPARALVCTDGAAAATAPDAAASPASLLASCSQTDLPTLAIDTVNTSLYGAGAPFEGERRSAVYAKIAARQSDVMCLLQVQDQTDRDAIASAAKGWFPYVYEITTDLSTPPAADADGGVPPAASAPPCSGVGATYIQNIYGCTATNCSTDAGTLAFTDDCLSQACTLPFSYIYEHGTQDDTCFDCIVDYLSSFETLTYGQSECTTDSRQPFGFNGQTTAMILSHYPLANTDSLVLPSTNWRRQVLYAEVELEDAPVDFYCAHLSAPNIDADQPYVGNYGKDQTTTLPDGGLSIENGYEDEQDLQVQRVIAYVQQKSGQTGRPAILAGFWTSGVQLDDSTGNTVLANQSPEVLRALDGRYGGAFVRADPPGYQPACDQCPQNPYDTGQPALDQSATFLFQYPADSTTDESFWGTENDVPIQGSPHEPPPDGGAGPAFESYPRSVRLVRPRAP
jgi:hypothetical protein